MENNFFDNGIDPISIENRINQIETGKVGFYSVGLYPASLAYNCAMQNMGENLLLSPRPGRKLLGAFPNESIEGMDQIHVERMLAMGSHKEGEETVNNKLSDLILRCELVILSANSKHIQSDLQEAIRLRIQLQRQRVVIACLAGSFCHDAVNNQSYVLCEKYQSLAFFSGFHRHGALRNPLDSFTANFTHPDALSAMLGARMLDKLSPNIQVSPGVHNLEAQYIKAAKNMASVFAGFGHTFHSDNQGLLPTLLTLLLNQCLDQAASVSMCRKDRIELYKNQPFSLTELGYGVQRIEAALIRDGDMEQVRDHTFSQLTAMVADVRGSMMYPQNGTPTRNFIAGQILAKNMKKFRRCPENIDEFIDWCETSGLKSGALEGLRSLEYWPQIIVSYSIPLHDASLINLLYMAIFAESEFKNNIFDVMADSRELTNYCQESVRPTHSRKYAEALNNLADPESIQLLVNSVISKNIISAQKKHSNSQILKSNTNIPSYIKTMKSIEGFFN